MCYYTLCVCVCTMLINSIPVVATHVLRQWVCSTLHIYYPLVHVNKTNRSCTQILPLSLFPPPPSLCTMSVTCMHYTMTTCYHVVCTVRPNMWLPQCIIMHLTVLFCGYSTNEYHYHPCAPVFITFLSTSDSISTHTHTHYSHTPVHTYTF